MVQFDFWFASNKSLKCILVLGGQRETVLSRGVEMVECGFATVEMVEKYDLKDASTYVLKASSGRWVGNS
ncbi:MAG: hypothetical protein KDA69_11710 [Planctomycetaceae bacterium]|nr:hypothetical protein [Planctomycetaceae bacterium]